MMGPKLTTHRVQLSRITEDDFEMLYEWITDTENTMLWSNTKQFPSKKSYFDFLQFKLDNSFISHFLIKNQDDKAVGTIFVHDENISDGIAFMSIYVMPEYRKLFYGVESCYLVFDYLFSYFSFRKVYMDTYSYNLDSINLLEKLGFKKEGDFKEHRYFNGSYHGLMRYAFYRDDWYAIKPKFALKKD